jgi:CheY-like chemotaxis protein
VFCALLCVIVVDKVPEGADVIDQLFRERERLSDEAATALAQGVVEALDMIGLATLFADCSMPFGRKNCRVGLPKISVGDRTLAVDWWERGPELASRLLGSCPDCDANNLARITVECQPDPLLPALTSDKRPQFIALQGQAPLFCPDMLTERGWFSYFLFT